MWRYVLHSWNQHFRIYKIRFVYTLLQACTPVLRPRIKGTISGRSAWSSFLVTDDCASAVQLITGTKEIILRCPFDLTLIWCRTAWNCMLYNDTVPTSYIINMKWDRKICYLNFSRWNYQHSNLLRCHAVCVCVCIKRRCQLLKW